MVCVAGAAALVRAWQDGARRGLGGCDIEQERWKHFPHTQPHCRTDAQVRTHTCQILFESIICLWRQIREHSKTSKNSSPPLKTIMSTETRQLTGTVHPQNFAKVCMRKFVAGALHVGNMWSQVSHKNDGCRSRICLCPEGDSPTSLRVFEALAAGSTTACFSVLTVALLHLNMKCTLQPQVP